MNANTIKQKQIGNQKKNDKSKKNQKPTKSSNKPVLKNSLKRKVSGYIYSRRIALILSSSTNCIYNQSRPTAVLIKLWIRIVRILVLCHRYYMDTKNAFESQIKELKTFSQYGICELPEVRDTTINTKAEMMNYLSKTFNKEPELSRINRDCLRMERVVRTRAEIVSLKNEIKKLPKLEYLTKLVPDMLEKFFKLCWLEEFEADRIIVKQYQIPRRFYVVVKGSLVCTYKTSEDSKSTTVSFIENGMTFGDLPITSGSMHTTTLMSRSHVQLLVLKASDFFDIFVGTKTEDDSLANVSFLDRVDCLKGWPVEFLTTNLHSIKACSYKRNQVVINDSNVSRYVYIVKSGYMSVWTKLRLNNSKHDKKLITGFYEEHLETDNNILPKNLLLENHHFDVLNFHNNKKLFKGKDAGEKRKDIETKMKYNQTLAFLSGLKLRDRQLIQDSEEEKDSSDKTVKKKVIKWAHNGTIIKYQEKIIEKKDQNQISLPRLKVKDIPKSIDAIKIQNVYEREVFGLQDILFDSQPSMQVISNGCECILIPKELFIQNSRLDYLKHLRKTISPYPKLTEIQMSYLKQLEWKNVTKEYLNEAFNTSNRDKVFLNK